MPTDEPQPSQPTLSPQDLDELLHAFRGAEQHLQRMEARYDRVEEYQRRTIFKLLADPDRLFWWVFLLAAVAVVTGLGVLIYKALSASGQVDFCKIVSDRNGGVTLIAHRPWTEDTHTGHPNIDAALEYAHKVGCPVK